MFGLGLLPKGALVGAALVVAALGTTVGVQSCTIDGLRKDLADAEQAAAVAEATNNACTAAVWQLEQANKGLADAAAAQTRAVQGYLAAGEQARAASAAALAQAERAAVTHRQVAADLAEIVRRRSDYVRPGECEAAAALRVVRERWQ